MIEGCIREPSGHGRSRVEDRDDWVRPAITRDLADAGNQFAHHILDAVPAPPAADRPPRPRRSANSPRSSRFRPSRRPPAIAERRRAACSAPSSAAGGASPNIPGDRIDRHEIERVEIVKTVALVAVLHDNVPAEPVKEDLGSIAKHLVHFLSETGRPRTFDELKHGLGVSFRSLSRSPRREVIGERGSRDTASIGPQDMSWHK